MDNSIYVGMGESIWLEEPGTRRKREFIDPGIVDERRRYGFFVASGNQYKSFPLTNMKGLANEVSSLIEKNGTEINFEPEVSNMVKEEDKDNFKPENVDSIQEENMEIQAQIKHYPLNELQKKRLLDILETKENYE